MAKQEQPVDRWAEDNRLAENPFAYGVSLLLVAAVVAFLLFWLVF